MSSTASSTIRSLVATAASSTAAASASSTTRAKAQGGIFEGLIPTQYDTKMPITLFIIQAVIVISFTRILHWPLSKLRQPRVIAEVITGIILGPSIMGRIPGFTNTIFPTASMPAFNLVANLGLVLFLFLVGLEVDLRFLVSNWRIALSVGAMGMLIPFGLGFAIAWGLYHQFHHEAGLVPISFGIYALFIGIATAITAFPVLCRILTSLRLLGTPVGVIVLSAGVANDVVGWILLALCVTLVNSGAGLTALWIFLVAIGYSLFVAYPVRWAFMWVLRKTGSLSNGPSQSVVALTLFLVLTSAFFTDIIGIHPIFGAFMIGLICPHEGGFAIKITEKIEDLVSTLFLPLYFALSGLSTNLGLLDNGITWAYVIGVTAVAFFGKLGGGTIAARLNGLLWRESVTIGILMSCKGLVELIVLNIGLQAKILSTRTFTIFVVMALVTTFATTPLTIWAYPPAYQQKVELWKKGKIDWDGNPVETADDSANSDDDETKTDVTNKMLVYLRLDGLPSLFNIVSLFTGGQHRDRSRSGSVIAPSEGTQNHEKSSAAAAHNTVTTSSQVASLQEIERPLRIHGLRLVELTERESSVMKVSELEEYATRDPIIKAFGTSAAAQRSSRNVTFSGQIAVVPEQSFSTTLVNRAIEIGSDFVLVPWSETGSVSEHSSLFDLQAGSDPLSNKQYGALAVDVFDKALASSNVGVFVDKTLITRSSIKNASASMTSPIDRSGRHLTRSVTGLSLRESNDQSVMFRSYDSHGRRQIRALYGGHKDDLLAVKLALQLAKNDDVEVRIVSTVGLQGKPGNSVTHTEHDFEFEEVRSSLSTRIASRVQFEDLSSAPTETVASSLLLNKTYESGDITLIIGRHDPADVSSPSSSKLNEATVTVTSPGTPRGTSGFPSSSGQHVDQTRPLGTWAAAMLTQMKDLNVCASMLVVQAKINAENLESSNHNLKRKTSRESSIATM